MPIIICTGIQIRCYAVTLKVCGYAAVIDYVCIKIYPGISTYLPLAGQVCIAIPIKIAKRCC